MLGTAMCNELGYFGIDAHGKCRLGLGQINRGIGGGINHQLWLHRADDNSDFLCGCGRKIAPRTVDAGDFVARAGEGAVKTAAHLTMHPKEHYTCNLTHMPRHSFMVATQPALAMYQSTVASIPS